MALLHWRKFVFFDENNVHNTELNQLISKEEPEDANRSFSTVNISCSSSGRGTILLGDTNGYVYLVNKQLRVNSFRANQRQTTHVKQVPKLALFITCGSDQSGINPLIKLWDPDKTDRLGQPTCIRLIRANSGFTKPSLVTSIDCNDLLTLMVVGYQDGSIVLFHGDITRQRRSHFGRPIKLSEWPITGIVIRGEIKTNNQTLSSSTSSYLSPTSGSVTETTAFISTEQEIFYATFSEKTFSKVLLDHLGCSSKCCCLLNVGENLFAVGRHNAVYFYQVDGRGPCLAFEGQKLILYRYRSYLVIISRDQSSKTDSTKVRRPQVAAGKNFDLSDATKRVNLNIYDIRNKFIAHNSTIPEVKEIVSEWGQLFIVCSDGQMLLLREKDTQTKLETLFRKNQFGLVIDIAKAHQYNEDALTDIFRHYGDHLYAKGDFDGAIAQYIKTIGRSEPSYVIKKFLDSNRISNLTVYLEALHKKYQASQDHTKLLLNCYSKLGSDQQLKQFIESYEDGNIKFDVDIAIKVLREAGFYEFALYLANKHQKHDWFFRVQIDDMKDSDAALNYMEKMDDPAEMGLYLKRYGRIMLRDSPQKTIAMIKTICSRSLDSKEAPQSSTLERINLSRRIYPEEFFHIFVANNDLFVQLLEQLAEDGSDFATKAVYNLLLELYLNAWRKERDDIIRSTRAEKIKKLLSRPNERFDLDQALILCRNNRFDEGLIDLYERAKLYNLVLQYHIDQDDSLKIIKTCEKFGCEHPNLYMPALIHYSKNGDERLVQLLKVIEHYKVIPPMVVIKILLGSRRTCLGSVKDYLLRFLTRIRDRNLDNETAIDHYKDDTEVVRLKIEEFENHQTVFKPSKCSHCQNVLDLPSVHFLCTHSFCSNCFHSYSAEHDECPICVSDNRKLLDAIGSHETSKKTLRELEKQFSTPSEDSFHGLAKLFGYGLFN